MSAPSPNRARALAFVVVFGFACGGSDPPTSSSPAPVVAPAPRLSAIDARVFRPLCTAACHSGGTDNAAGGLDLTTGLHDAEGRVLWTTPRPPRTTTKFLRGIVCF